ncbi:MAG: selenocysteine-specific translation elongation factor [Planctomycetota bacterium]|jgi:selenocysteine-specific elongation factor
MTTARKNIMLGTAGHVDHGKTALVKILTGCDTDTLAVEKQRGLTIELGFAPCQMADERIVGVVDVPGHANFIRNMVAGAHGIDVVIFVVAADDGVMPQTREHLDILTLMGVRRGLIALTKIDLVDDTLQQMAVDDVREYAQGTFLADAPICPVSNITGEGYDGLLTALNVAVAASEGREVSGLFRLWVERAFSIRGFGTVASGIPVAGEVHATDMLQVLPAGRTARVRGLEVYGHDAEIGRAGECVAVNLSDIDAESVPRGSVLCAAGVFEPVSMAEAELTILPSARKPLVDYAEVHLHVGTAEMMTHVALLEGEPIAPGGRAMVQLRLAHPLAVAAGDRFVLRTSAGDKSGGAMTTIGGGRILSTTDIRLRRNRPWTLETLRTRRDAMDSSAAWCGVVLAESGEPLSVHDLARRAAMPVGQTERLVEQLRQGGVASLVGGKWLHREALARAAGAVTEALAAFHEQNVMREGAQPTELFADLQVSFEVCKAAVEKLIGDEIVVRHGDLIALAGRGAAISDADRALCDRIEQRLRDTYLAPPLPAELIDELGITAGKLSQLTRLLADHDSLVQLAEKVIMHRDAIDAAQQVVRDLFASQPNFTTMEFRDALGVSRKYAVPLLDYFDTIKLTVRQGNRRRPGAAVKQSS